MLFVGCLLGGCVVGLMATSSKRTQAAGHSFQVCCSQSPHPCGRPLLTHASNGDIQTLKCRSGSVSPGVTVSCCACFVYALQVSLEGMRFVSKHDFAPPTVLLGFFFALGCKVSFLVRSNILLSMIIHLLVAILDLSQVSTYPSTPPS